MVTGAPRVRLVALVQRAMVRLRAPPAPRVTVELQVAAELAALAEQQQLAEAAALQAAPVAVV